MLNEYLDLGYSEPDETIIDTYVTVTDWSKAEGSPLLSKFNDGVNVMRLSITKDRKLMFEYEGSTVTSGSTIQAEEGEPMWLRASFKPDDVSVDCNGTKFFATKEWVVVRRARVKPWRERWWKPWDSVEWIDVDETEWVEL